MKSDTKRSRCSRSIFIPGKLGIELERKMVIHNERDPEVWKKPIIDEKQIEMARRVSSSDHQVIK